MRHLLQAFLPIALIGVTLISVQAADVELTLQPGQELNRIDEKIYSHFLEHIYHSVNGGLWGELVWNRSFEDNSQGGWSQEDGVDGSVIVQKSLDDDQRFVFGDASWTDYELTLEAQKTGGAEGFLVLFRVQNDKEFSWANLGGWQNKQHGVERRNARQNRQGVVGPMPSGSIETGKWYSIRVRCEGDNVKVFLDGRQILDVTDPEMAKSGRVGIGTWSTQAKFRNIKVTSLDGQSVLFDKTPEVSQQIKLRNWEPFGDVEIQLFNNIQLSNDYAPVKPLNGKYALLIKPTENSSGIAQKGFVLKKGEEYAIGLWVSWLPTTSDILHLPLIIEPSFDNIFAKKVREDNIIAHADGGWHLMAWTFIPDEDVDDATLRIHFTNPHSYLIAQASIMPKSWLANGGFRPDLLNAIADIKPPVVRWPGGCFASAYRWKDGIGPQEKRQAYPLSIWDDRDVNSFGTDEFVAMCRHTGSEPLIVINTGTPGWNARRTPESADVDWVQEACDWLEYCNGPATSKWGKVRADNGRPEPYNVKYWEIDNEIESSVEEYMATLKTFIPALKKIDPTIKIIACGSWRGNREHWDNTLVNEVGELFDYLSFHQYDDPNTFKDGPGKLEQYFRELQKVIEQSPNPNIKIFDSEWNAQSTDWCTGLYCGGMLNVFERCGDVVEMAAPALFLRHNVATAWDNAFINFDNKSWYPAPNYVVMKLWREHYAPIRIGIDGDASGLNVVATKSEDGKTLYLKAVNPTRESCSVTLNTGTDIAEATLKLVTAGSLSDRNTLENPNAIAPKDGEVKRDGQTVRFELSAYSAGIVVVQSCQTDGHAVTALP